MAKKISETKATCKSCGHIYFYGRKDELDQAFSHLQADLNDTPKNLLCCTGCLPALLIPDAKRKEKVDFDKCPKCGSRAVTKEKIVHEV
jgi:predicted nucleic-acid-binding Zn-ribbon protein